MTIKHLCLQALEDIIGIRQIPVETQLQFKIGLA